MQMPDLETHCHLRVAPWACFDMFEIARAYVSRAIGTCLANIAVCNNVASGGSGGVIVRVGVVVLVLYGSCVDCATCLLCCSQWRQCTYLLMFVVGLVLSTLSAPLKGSVLVFVSAFEILTVLLWILLVV